MGHDKIANRLGLILQKLNEGEHLSLEELSQEFNVSLRTLQRDFNERLNFLPLEVDENGYYHVPQYCLGKLNFKDVRTILQKNGLVELYPNLGNNFIVDMLNEKVTNAYKIEGLSYEDISKREKEFFTLNIAILNHKKLSFVYADKPRVVNPYKLVNTHGIWYLIADDEGVLKNFSFTKINTLNALEEEFEPTQAFLSKIDTKETTWVTHNEIDVVIEVDNSVVEYFKRRDLLPKQKIISQTPTHTNISAVVSFEEEILSFVRYWIPHVTIISPLFLQQKLQDTLQTYLKDKI